MRWFWGFVSLAFYFLCAIQKCVQHLYSFDVCWTAVEGQNQRASSLVCVCLLHPHSWVLPLTSGGSYTLNFAMLPICCMFSLEWYRSSSEHRINPWLLARGCFSPLVLFCWSFGFVYFLDVCVFTMCFCTGWKSYCKPRCKTGQQNHWSEGKERAVLQAWLQVFILRISNPWSNKSYGFDGIVLLARRKINMFCGFAWYYKSTGFLNPKCSCLLTLIKEHILVVQRQTLMIWHVAMYIQAFICKSRRWLNRNNFFQDFFSQM